ncbi:hypothetical protein L3Q82_015644 [Scortum barcoo]|uniref:Uncharacterized protein n=1 Tax=Scortum barcoo TaxID=214431 RepID=A0ACB8VNL0_9TELE|nr:hypothetical protein L3Q82_015644 [Scortum barcoo]
MIRDSEVERVSKLQVPGHPRNCDDLTWTLNITQLVKKAHQRLYFLRRLRKFGISQRTFYTAIIKSILTSWITVWYGNSTAADCKHLQRVLRMAEGIVWAPQPCLQDIYHRRVHRRACSIIRDPFPPPAHTLQSSALWQEVQECEEQDLQAEGQFLSTSHKTHQQIHYPCPPHNQSPPHRSTFHTNTDTHTHHFTTNSVNRKGDMTVPCAALVLLTMVSDVMFPQPHILRPACEVVVDPGWEWSIHLHVQ